MSIYISKHAKKRLKERNGLNVKSFEKVSKKAFNEGIRHDQTKGRLNKWITSLYFNNKSANNIRLYGDKAFIFTGETLITVLQIPANLMKDLKTMIKK